jgi:hypothetical protein
LAIWKQNALSAAFYLLHTAVGNGAMNKYGICRQWRKEVFTIGILVFSIGNGAMDARQYWGWHNERFAM